MNYKVEIRTDGKMEIIEKDTGHIIKTYDNPLHNKREIAEYLNFLNDGGGFDGWTPAFVLKQLDYDFSLVDSEDGDTRI